MLSVYFGDEKCPKKNATSAVLFGSRAGRAVVCFGRLLVGLIEQPIEFRLQGWAINAAAVEELTQRGEFILDKDRFQRS